MDIKKLKKLSKKDLEKRLEDKRRELIDLNYELTSGKSNDTTKKRDLKKEIARILTLINADETVVESESVDSEEEKE